MERRLKCPVGQSVHRHDCRNSSKMHVRYYAEATETGAQTVVHLHDALVLLQLNVASLHLRSKRGCNDRDQVGGLTLPLQSLDSGVWSVQQ